MSKYIPRKLIVLDNAGQSPTIDETELATSSKPIVVLAEPGMGKTRLMRRLASLPGHSFISAARFVTLPNPASHIGEGATVLIDGLDELSAAQEADPINRVLGKLIEAGSPPFILSCRAADWRGAVARQDIADAYGQPPRQMSLQPFGRDNAVAFLAEEIGRERADAIIASLDEAGIPDVYGNPLSLELFAAVAAQTEIPKTRAELLSRATSLMCREASDRRPNSALASLDTQTALAAAGAISAAFVLTGSEAVTKLPSAAFKPATLPVAEIAALPGAAQSSALLDSRLFMSVPEVDGAFKPIHRGVAEFLGARWLASAARDDLACDRLLALLTIDGGVPASLRGIHAWLARDPRFAPRVIATDPYAIIAYGDADTLPVAEARMLLAALQTYQKANPYFRAEDWKTYSAKSLTSPELLADVRELILSADTTFHLRSLILGLIPDSPLATPLAPDLKRILCNTDGFFSYSERSDAIEVLVRLASEQADLKRTVAELAASDDEDTTRLALDIINGMGFTGYTADEIADAIVAHLGMTGGKVPRQSRSTNLFGISRNLPAALVADVLDALAERLPQRDYDSPPVPYELGTLVDHLVARQLAAATPAPPQLLRWLRLNVAHTGYRDDDRKKISAYIRAHDDLRHAMQREVLFDDTGKTPLVRIWHMDDINPALEVSADDIVHHLNDLAVSPNRDAKSAAVWRDLAAYIPSSGEAAARIAAAARPFATGNAELEAHLAELQQPRPTPEWQIRQQERQAKHEREKAEGRARNRQQFGEHEADIRAGELRWICPPAQAYLALYSDIDDKLSPPDRIAHWLGPELRDAALAGFEAVLLRKDIPSPEQVANGYAEKKRWNFCLPMIAAVCERVRTGVALDTMGANVLVATAIALQNEVLGGHIDEGRCLQALEAVLRKDPIRFERYARLLIEPFLAARSQHIMGLHALTRSQHDQPLAARLAAEWLTAFPDLPVDVEATLIDALVGAGNTATLKSLASQHAMPTPNEPARFLNWLAIRFLTDFAAVAPSLTPMKDEDKQLLWYIRTFIGHDRRKPGAGLAVAPDILAWIIGQFRGLWPYTRLPSSSSGDTNAWDATDFLKSLISRLASDTSRPAAAALHDLAKAPRDGYTDLLLYSLDAQHRARRERAFAGVTVSGLKSVLHAEVPRTAADLLAVVRFALGRLQAELRGGNDTDTIKKYWSDAGAPRDEDTCTDLLIEDLDRLMPVSGVLRIPQRDMAQGKRADIAYKAGDVELPVECKGQWHRDLWTAASTQLDALYVSNWRSQDQGLFVVYWFGPGVPSGKRLCPAPEKHIKPQNADELRLALAALLPPERAGSIAIEVLDLTRR